MGRVTFDGDVATVESQAFIRSEELRILSDPGDQFQKARQLELMYLENGLEPGTMIRGGVRNVRQDYDDEPESGGGMFKSLIGKLLGFLLLIIAIGLAGRWGLG